MVFPAYLADGLQFFQGVQHAKFVGVGQVDHPRHHHMVSVAVLLVVRQAQGNSGGGNFPFFRGNGQDFVAACLNGTGFVYADVAAVSRNDALVGPEYSTNYGCIGLGAAADKMDGCARGAAGLPDSLPGRLTDGIGAVARGFQQIGIQQPLQDGRMGPFLVIAGKIQFLVFHKISSFLGRLRVKLILFYSRQGAGASRKTAPGKASGIPLVYISLFRL